MFFSHSPFCFARPQLSIAWNRLKRSNLYSWGIFSACYEILKFPFVSTGKLFLNHFPSYFISTKHTNFSQPFCSPISLGSKHNNLLITEVLTLISSDLCASGSIPAAGSTLIFCALDARSAMDSVIFLCVWLDVECGLNVSFSLNTDWACKPVPWENYHTNIIFVILNLVWVECWGHSGQKG